MVIYNGPVYLPIMLKLKHVYPFARPLRHEGWMFSERSPWRWSLIAIKTPSPQEKQRAVGIRRENFHALTFEKNLLFSGEDGGRPVAEK